MPPSSAYYLALICIIISCAIRRSMSFNLWNVGVEKDDGRGEGKGIIELMNSRERDEGILLWTNRPTGVVVRRHFDDAIKLNHPQPALSSRSRSCTCARRWFSFFTILYMCLQSADTDIHSALIDIQKRRWKANGRRRRRQSTIRIFLTLLLLF